MPRGRRTPDEAQAVLDGAAQILTAASVKRGKSIVERIREDLDEAYALWVESPTDLKWGRGQRAYGIAQALGRLRNSSAEYEIEQAKERYVE